jgi:hypothetical protein
MEYFKLLRSFSNLRVLVIKLENGFDDPLSSRELFKACFLDTVEQLKSLTYFHLSITVEGEEDESESSLKAIIDIL